MKPLRYFTFLFILSAIPTSAFAATVNDPLFAQQWSLRQTHVPAAWDITMGDPAVVVAVIDTGIDMNQPEFANAIWTNPYEIAGNGIDDDNDGYIDNVHGWNFVNDSPDTQPMKVMHQLDESYSHGAAVASIIAARANDRYGMAGVAPNVQILPITVLDGDGFGANNNLASAIRYATAKNVRIMNISVTGFEDNDEVRFALYEAQQRGIVIVAAVGNSGAVEGQNLDEVSVYPACNGKDTKTSTFIRVTGTDSIDQHAPHANFGASCTDIAAPGHELIGAHPLDLPSGSEETETYTHVAGLTGTSVASPMVAGTAALIASANPKLTGAEIRQVLLTTTDSIEPDIAPGQKGQLGYGRLNAEKALKKALLSTASLAGSQSVKPAIGQEPQWGRVFRFWLGR